METMEDVYLELSVEEYQELVDSHSGICLACGAFRWGDTEPDAANYPCGECGENKVQGIENALISGNIELSED